MKPVAIDVEHHLHRIRVEELAHFLRCPHRYFRASVMKQPEGPQVDATFVGRAAFYALRGLLWSKQSTGAQPEERDVQAAVEEVMSSSDTRAQVNLDLVDQAVAKVWAWFSRFNIIPVIVNETFEMELGTGATKWVLAGKSHLVFKDHEEAAPKLAYLDLEGRFFCRSAHFLRNDIRLALALVGTIQGLGVGLHSIQVHSFPPDYTGHEGEETVLDLKLEADDFNRALVTVNALRSSIRDHLRDERWWPNRQAAECRRRFCRSWKACQKAFGGEIQS